jgi:hypothetical protein
MIGSGKSGRLSSAGLVLAALAVGLGLVVGGGLIGLGFVEGRQQRPVVTVKGLAERFVSADLAVWPLRFSAPGEDLGTVQAKIDADLAAITAFLTEHGIEAEAIRPQRVEVTDVAAQAYRQGPVGDNRFIVAQTILVRTGQVELVAELARLSGELVRQGIVLEQTGGPAYLFTRLNEIKPEMIAEATANARAAAAQFATDAGTEVEGIRRASQGLFQILPRDPVPGLPEPSQLEKKVRVVTTIDYHLD